MSLKKKKRTVTFLESRYFELLNFTNKIYQFCNVCENPKKQNSYEWLLQVKSPNYYIYDQHQEFKKETELKSKCTVYIVFIFCSHLINLHTKLNEIKELKRREYTN